MTWRIVSINSVAKLDLRLNYLVVRGGEIKKIHLSEIAVLIIENTAVSLTAALLCELNRRKIRVIFCDERRYPFGEIIPFYGSHDSTEKLRIQMKWDKTTKMKVWTEIVKEKITNQRNLLRKLGFQEEELLTSYLNDLQLFDSTNREGHAAKVYFNALFGKDFSRGEDTPTNACLNYGYSLFLSAVDREIVSSGYFTQLGIFHDNVFNPHNLGSDLMEPFRPLIDEVVVEMMPEELDTESKRTLLDVFNKEVIIDDRKNFVNNAVKIYCKSVLNAITENDTNLLKFCTYEI